MWRAIDNNSTRDGCDDDNSDNNNLCLLRFFIIIKLMSYGIICNLIKNHQRNCQGKINYQYDWKIPEGSLPL